MGIRYQTNLCDLSFTVSHCQWLYLLRIEHQHHVRQEVSRAYQFHCWFLGVKHNEGLPLELSAP